MCDNDDKRSDSLFDFLWESWWYYPFIAFDIRRLAKGDYEGEEDLLCTSNEILSMALHESDRCLKSGHPIGRSAASVLSLVLDVFFADASAWRIFPNYGLPIHLPLENRDSLMTYPKKESKTKPPLRTAGLSKEYIETAWSCVYEACYHPLLALVGEMNSEKKLMAAIGRGSNAESRTTPSERLPSDFGRILLLVLVEATIKNRRLTERQISKRLDDLSPDDIFENEQQTIYRRVRILREDGYVKENDETKGYCASMRGIELFREEANTRGIKEAIREYLEGRKKSEKPERKKGKKKYK